MAPQRTMKYNPAFLSDEDLLSSYIVRQVDLELILQILKENVTGSNQHVLVVGPRGSGKTTLALAVAAKIRRDKELGYSWYPLVFGEESYEVGTPGEFWLEALFHLAQQTGDEYWRRTFEDLNEEKDDARLRERALAQLMDFADRQGKRILLIVENFNMLVGDQLKDKDGWVLRHTLSNEPRIMLLATATNRFNESVNSDKAMFELFKFHDLKPLIEEECRALWESRTGKAPAGRNLRPIQILTGGNPRLITILASFASGLSLRKLMEDLMGLVDDHTEYFKSHLDSLPPVERKAYLALAEIWDPATAGEVAKISRLTVNKASSLLNRLIGRGAVIVAKGEGRTKRYQVAERMYNIYYLMRRRGAPSGRIHAVVNFMVSFYDPQELAEAASAIASEACNLDLKSRKEHYLVYQGIIERSKDLHLRELILQSTPQEFFVSGDISQKLWDKGSVSSKVGPRIKTEPELKSTLQRIRKAIDGPGPYEKLERICRKAIRMFPSMSEPYVLLGRLFCDRLNRYEEAEEAFRKALEIKPDYSWGWAHLGQLLRKHLARYKDSEEAYGKAIAIKPDYSWAWGQLGQLLHENLKRNEEAEEAYRKAVEIDPDYAWAWGELGRLLHESLNRYEEAEKAYRKAVEISPDDAWAWAQLGQLLHENLNRYNEAEAAYRKAVEISPDSAWTWAQLGQLLHENLNRYEEAEAAYRKAVEISPDYAWAWAHLGWLLHENLNQYEEAEKAYRMALEIKPDYAWAWGRLIAFHAKAPNMASAIEFAENLISRESANATLMHSLARIFYKYAPRDALSRAEAWATEAAKLDPKIAYSSPILSLILIANGKPGEALASAAKSLQDPNVIRENLGGWTDLFIDLAAADCALDALKNLENSPSAEMLEPLIAGLRLYLDKDVNVAAEILEIAHDVKHRIEDRRQKMKNSLPVG